MSNRRGTGFEASKCPHLRCVRGLLHAHYSFGLICSDCTQLSRRRIRATANRTPGIPCKARGSPFGLTQGPSQGIGEREREPCVNASLRFCEEEVD
jgi:hypothetical protein